jgi:hypothetical protein
LTLDTIGNGTFHTIEKEKAAEKDEGGGRGGGKEEEARRLAAAIALREGFGVYDGGHSF